MAGFRAALLVLATQAACTQPSVQQHGVSFQPVRQGSNQLWITELEVGGTLATDVAVAPAVLAWLRADGYRPKLLYVSIDPDAHHYTFAAGAEIGRFVEDLRLFGGPGVQMAFSKASDRPERLPVVDCSQASPDTGVIVVEQGGRNEVVRDGDCVRATYHVPQDSLRVADRLCYGLAGIL